jgi:hypothetical protein
VGSCGVSRDCPDAKSFGVNGRELLAVNAGWFLDLCWSGHAGSASQVGATIRGWS